jgi:hypothetical protein
MSTYVRALSPAKTVVGSDTSLLSRRSRNLWERRRKQSGLHSFTIAAPLRVRHACARQCCTSACVPEETTTSIEHTHHNGHRYANARNMHLKLWTYTSDGNVQAHVYAVNEVLLPHNAFAKHANNMYIYSHTIIKHTPQYDSHT